MGTKNNPGNFDCYANANPDEPMFVLLARDILAPTVVEEWCIEYEMRHLNRTEKQKKKLAEAYKCAAAMRKWRQENT